MPLFELRKRVTVAFMPPQANFFSPLCHSSLGDRITLRIEPARVICVVARMGVLFWKAVRNGVVLLP